MASPFKLFRKNQKVLLAIFGVAIIIVFTLGGIITKMQRGGMGGGYGNEPVALAWQGGDVTENDLARMRIARNQLRELFRLAARKATEKNPKFQPKVGGIPDTDDEKSVVQTMILAKLAEQMGMTVSDRAIFDFLRLFTDGELDDADGNFDRRVFNDLLGEASGQRMTRDTLLAALRRELMARQVAALASSGFTFPQMVTGRDGQTFLANMPITPPAEAWAYYKRLYRPISAEFLPVRVDDYVGQVKQKPIAKEVLELFEKYKNDLPNPYRREPAFKRPHRIAFQYVKADYKKMVDAEKEKITEAEIEDYYNKNKNSFRRVELPPEKEAAPAESGIDEEKPDKVPESGAGEGVTPLQDDPADNGEKKNEAPPDNPAPSSSAADVEETEAKSAAKEQPAGVDEATGAGGEAKGESKKTDGDDGKTAVTKPKYKSLEDVKDEIRDDLARDRAGAKIKDAFDIVSARIRRYDDDILFWAPDEHGGQPKPPPVDLEKLAGEQGLEAGETPLVDRWEISEKYELGATYHVFKDPGSPMGYRTVTFVQIAYADNVAAYKPEKDMTGPNREEYLFWKTDKEEEERVPELSEVRKEIVAAWKRLKARRLALQAADELAKSARSANGSLKDQFGDKVVQAKEFYFYDLQSRFMFQMGQGNLVPTDIPGISGVGEQFLKGVFSLEDGRVGAFPNEPFSIVYVVRVRSDPKLTESLREQFMARLHEERFGETLPREIMAIAMQERSSLFQQWYQDVLTEMKVQWKRKPRGDSRS